MQRRDFLKAAGWSFSAAAFAPEAWGRLWLRKKEVPAASAELHFPASGRFRILQLTDTHHIAQDPRSERSRRLIPYLLDTEKPDLVIHTGDIFYSEDILASLHEVFDPIVEREIPFAVTLGNHDGQFGLSREEVMEAIRRFPRCLNAEADKGIPGASNDVLTLSGKQGLERVFYLLDSGDSTHFPGYPERFRYAHIQAEQIDWYRRQSRRIRKEAGRRIPATLFLHIPLREVPEAFQAQGGALGRTYSEPGPIVGSAGEWPCPADKNSGLLCAVMEEGDVDSIVSGHDHDCDYVLRYDGMTYLYGRYSGGDTEYNHLGRDGMVEDSALRLSGGRMLEFREGDPGHFDTWIRLFDGSILHPLSF